MSSFDRKIIMNYVYNAGYQLLAIIVPLLTAPYVSRVLNPQGVGYSSYTNSIIQYFVMLASLGISMYGNREIAYVRNRRKELSKTFWSIQSLRIITTLLSYILFLIFLDIYNNYEKYLLAQSINIIAIAFDISWLYMGLEDFKITVLRNTIVKLFTLFAIFIFIHEPDDVVLYIIIISTSSLIGNLTLWSHVRKYVDFCRISVKDIFLRLRPTIVLFVPQISTSVYLQLNKTMLGYMMGSTYSGFYQNTDNLIKIILSFVTSLGTVMLPHMAATYAEGNKEKVRRLLYKSFDLMSLISIPMAFGIGAIGIKLGPFFYGNGFKPVGKALLLESIVIIFIAWSNTIGHQYLVPTNQLSIYTKSVTLGAVVNLILNFFLISKFGLNGAIVATVVSEFFVSIYQLWKVRKVINMSKIFKNVPQYLIAGIVMFLIIISISLNTNMTIFMLVVEITLGVIIYITTLFLVRCFIKNRI